MFDELNKPPSPPLKWREVEFQGSSVWLMSVGNARAVVSRVDEYSFAWTLDSPQSKATGTTHGDLDGRAAMGVATEVVMTANNDYDAHTSLISALDSKDDRIYWVYESAFTAYVKSPEDTTISVATVWPNGTWYTWDAQGTGGENSSSATALEAVPDAVKAVRRQNFHVVEEI